MANEERYNYIVLVIVWESRLGMEQIIRLIGLFHFIILLNAVYMEKVNTINQKNTDTSNTILAIIPCRVLPNDPTTPTAYFTTPSNVDCNNMKLKVGRFQSITLQVRYEDEILNIDGDHYCFVLKVFI
jgi:hypothetical protein